MSSEAPASGAGRLEKLIARQHRILGIYVTFRCPLECAHCGVDSHPRRQERIDTDFAVEQIERAAAEGTVHTLHLNGGEPFLERRLLARVSEKAQELCLGLAITTSAHWATSLERARKVLSDLPTLSQLMISTDVYHRPFVGLDNLVYAATASREKGSLTQIAICTPTGAEDEFVAEVRSVLGDALLDEVELILFPLDPVGRAAGLPEARWREIVDEPPAGRCVQLNRPVLLPDGTLSACCNTLVTNKLPTDNPLKLGNCRDTAIEELLPLAEDDFYIQAIRVGGPALLAKIAEEYGADGQLKRQYRKGDICHLCGDILHNDAIQRALKKAFQDRRVQLRIASLRAAVLGETEMLRRLTANPTDTDDSPRKGVKDELRQRAEPRVGPQAG